jgi:hypothetical protein
MKLIRSKAKSIDFRVSTLPTLFGEKIVMRILDSSGVKLGIEALGYDPDQQEHLMFAIGRPYGMILVTGPTGSGKTVSLYTCLNILNQPGVNISTAEDPAEIQLHGVNQSNVNEKAGLTFAAALRSFLRQDPDIIMVGEIRDWRPPTSRSRRRRQSPRTVDAPHQRRADHADAPAQHGRRAVQRRLLGHPDHGTAARPPLRLCPIASSLRTFRRKRCSGPGSQKRTSTARGNRWVRSAATNATGRATRAASASTR